LGPSPQESRFPVLPVPDALALRHPGARTGSSLPQKAHAVVHAALRGLPSRSTAKDASCLFSMGGWVNHVVTANAQEQRRLASMPSEGSRQHRRVDAISLGTHDGPRRWRRSQGVARTEGRERLLARRVTVAAPRTRARGRIGGGDHDPEVGLAGWTIFALLVLPRSYDVKAGRAAFDAMAAGRDRAIGWCIGGFWVVGYVACAVMLAKGTGRSVHEGPGVSSRCFDGAKVWGRRKRDATAEV
jgi:hypothetical protein